MISCHLGCDFSRDDSSTIHFAPRERAGKIVNYYYSAFGHKLKLFFTAPLEKGNHPELDATEHLD